MTNDQFKTQQRLRILFLPLVAVVLSASGCATMEGVGALSVLTRKADDESVAHGTCTVEVRDGWKPDVITIPIDADARVNDVLAASKVNTRFRHMKVYVERKVEGRAEPVRMTSRYDGDKRSVTIETDYAVAPGDKIIVMKDENTAIDNFVKSIFPL